jgi:hypothetical protein
MIDEYDAAEFHFSAANDQAAHPHQEQVYMDAIQALLFAAPPANRCNGLFAGQAISSTSQVATTSKPQCSTPGNLP